MMSTHSNSGASQIPFVPSAGGPTAWSTDQQQEFIRALISTPEVTGTESSVEEPRLSLTSDAGATREDPMAAMMNALTQLNGQGTIPGSVFPTEPAALLPKTIAEKLLPLIHLVAIWALLAFFALYKEPEAYKMHPNLSSESNFWRRWSELSWRSSLDSSGIQTVVSLRDINAHAVLTNCSAFLLVFCDTPAFAAFNTDIYQICARALAITVAPELIYFSMQNQIQPPSLLALALPHLPPALSSLVLHILSYVRIGSMLLDDIAGFVVGVGIIIWIANWIRE